MRAIKFRGKRLDNGEWWHGSLVILNGRYFIFNDEGRYEVSGATVGEFTELKDEKGREIYEGDIVQDEYEGVAKVCFDLYSWRLIYGIGDDGDQVQSFEELDGLRMAIIGNIHDNPELIKTE